MSIPMWMRTPRVRRGLAAGAVILAAGGLVLFRAPAGAQAELSWHDPPRQDLPTGPNAVRFEGPGVRGSLALSHTRVLAGGERRMFAELRMAADAADRPVDRAPLSMAIVIDTSGSMDGDKIEQARESVVRLVREMRDDDEIAVVRYSTESEVVQELARVGDVRERLVERVRSLRAGGGTRIAPALAHGVRALEEARKGRVRRVVLVSDGLDSTRSESEATARDTAERGITVSTMGIGLDFDESYMSSVAGIGHGNFAFVKDAASLAGFFARELKEGATTVAQNARARLRLPEGVRVVRVAGARLERHGEGEVELAVGSLFAGDERSVVVELAARVDAGEARGIDGNVSWEPVGSDRASARLDRIEVWGTTDAQAVEEARDGSVYARAVSAFASMRQIEAAAAFAAGDTRRAQALIDENVAELGQAAALVPAPAATAIAAQLSEYEKQRAAFGSAPPGSTEARAAAKAAVAKDTANLARNASF